MNMMGIERIDIDPHRPGEEGGECLLLPMSKMIMRGDTNNDTIMKDEEGIHLMILPGVDVLVLPVEKRGDNDNDVVLLIH
jgi:hypothetical protein